MASGPVVLTGASGILGSAFARLLRRDAMVCLGRAELDPAAPDAASRRIAALSASVVINCAGLIRMSRQRSATRRPRWRRTRRLPARLPPGPRQAARPCCISPAPAVMATGKTRPTWKATRCGPTTVHHRSKAHGEERVLRAHPASLVLRLGWVFGGAPGQRKNFVFARLVEAPRKISDRRQPGADRVPQFRRRRGDAIRRAAAGGGARRVQLRRGGARRAAASTTSRRSWRAAGSPAQVVAASFPRRAAVSPNEAACNRRLATLGLGAMRPWRVALTEFVHRLAGGGGTVTGAAWRTC